MMSNAGESQDTEEDSCVHSHRLPLHVHPLLHLFFFFYSDFMYHYAYLTPFSFSRVLNCFVYISTLLYVSIVLVYIFHFLTPFFHPPFLSLYSKCLLLSNIKTLFSDFFFPFPLPLIELSAWMICEEHQGQP